ncbi:relaxase/mobilization nuclease domain-containing protein [Youxingia wuxianensis]|uniref:Relaxase/mobilization nuclease domain-containing protein n=1 Tax=Youxingia wuxianensis TaxID=2763678 RepID=A0A926ETK3_9FIRM|nr:relaxase/mobilization nuclease domain-containing protein [Youxingia wuxianensis]MBC8586234.1 relaxase/mobilization nuclease domain-containing protein [Youxingia wuxianensis]
MATTRLMPLHTGKGRTVGQAISDILDYSQNPQKTDNGRLITSWQCDSRIADAEFLFTKNQYIQKTGRVRGEDDVIAYHLRQSFVPGEITPEEANRLGCELAKRFTKGKHAYIVCTHIDKEHIHNHVIWNSTALDQSRKFRNFWGSTRAVRRLNDTICIENGYSIVENPKRHGKSYNKWLGDKKKPSHRERICAAIDDALAQKPESFEALLELLRQAGYEIKGKKVPSLLGGEQQKSIRMDTLGAGYTPEDLRAVIAGEKEHTPRKRWTEKTVPEKRGGNLLVDIQAKLQEGKGAGYARWATLFNLKQMAQTVAYLQDHQLLDYSVLSEKAAAASTRFNELSAKIKAAEARMAEIAVMRTHIINYANTRDTYVAYRKAGYSKKFLAEHESEITLHKAAKKFFDDQGIQKLPTVKSLQAEYAALMAEKKVAYAEYRKAREDMKELLTAKANIDRILELEEDCQDEREKNLKNFSKSCDQRK